MKKLIFMLCCLIGLGLLHAANALPLFARFVGQLFANVSIHDLYTTQGMSLLLGGLMLFGLFGHYLYTRED